MDRKVAASNASDGQKQKADFCCDGIADQIEIQAAIDFPSGTLRVKLSHTEWVPKLSAYLSKEYQQIENRLEETLDFVALVKEHGNTYSHKFTSILRDSGSVFSSVMDELVRQLEQCVSPLTCPHGRPTMIHMSAMQLAQEFGRLG